MNYQQINFMLKEKLNKKKKKCKTRKIGSKPGETSLIENKS